MHSELESLKNAYLEEILAPLYEGIDLGKYAALVQNPTGGGELVVQLGRLQTHTIQVNTN